MEQQQNTNGGNFGVKPSNTGSIRNNTRRDYVNNGQQRSASRSSSMEQATAPSHPSAGVHSFSRDSKRTPGPAPANAPAQAPVAVISEQNSASKSSTSPIINGNTAIEPDP